jgi:TatD DNase family protein
LNQQDGWVGVTPRQLLIRQLQNEDEYEIVDLIQNYLDARHDLRAGSKRQVLRILRGWVAGLHSRSPELAGHPGVLHSFSATSATAREALELGFMIGVTGPVTFKNARARQELVAELPLDRILIETDSPYLTPVPHRGQRNEPAFVKYIAEKIAQILSCRPEEIAERTSLNSERLFSWGANA